VILNQRCLQFCCRFIHVVCTQAPWRSRFGDHPSWNVPYGCAAHQAGSLHALSSGHYTAACMHVATYHYSQTQAMPSAKTCLARPGTRHMPMHSIRIALTSHT
jgi:hypothetical protein